MLTALGRLDEITGLSEVGRRGLSMLASDVSGVTFPLTAHRFLLRFLFRDGIYLRILLADTSVRGQQRRLAIYQLLQFAFSFRARFDIDPKRAFLEQIRRLEVLDEEKQLRQLPAAASDIDAVRMMTVHAAKGLQFRTVHIPAVTSRHFPVNRPDPVKLPPGLIDNDSLMSRESEEESLFYVGLSRAEDGISLSRAVSYGGGTWADVAASSFLERIASHLPKSTNSIPVWKDVGEPEPAGRPLPASEAKDSWPAAAIETYISCPRSFYYDRVLGLEGSAPPTPYLRMNKAVRSTIRWMQAASSDKERNSGVDGQFKSDWDQTGLHGNKLETIYRSAAETMMAEASKLVRGASLIDELSLTLKGNVAITCRADHVIRGVKGIEVFRFKLSPLADREKPKPRYGVIQAALREQYPGVSVEFEHVSLLSGERRKATIQAKKLTAELEKLAEALAGITAGRFDPSPSDYDCPRCPYFFICPAHPEPTAD